MFTSIDFKSIQLVSIDFFPTKTTPTEFFSMKPIFKEMLYRNFFQEIPFYRFEFHGIQINQNCFFRYSNLKMNFRRIPVDGVGFNKFSLEEINFRGFSVHEAQFGGFPLTENKFLGFSRMKLISIDSHSTSFMLHGVTKADRFFPWVSEYLKLTSLLFSGNFFPKIFLKKNMSTCFSLQWIWFRCLSLSMTSVFFAFFLLEIVFLDF